MDTSNNATTWRWVIGTIVAAAAVIAIVWVIQHNRAKSGAASAQSASTASVSTAAGTSSAAVGTGTGGSLSVGNQPAGNSVAVSGMSLQADSWVAIKDKNGWYLGAARFAKGATQGVVPLLRNTKAGEAYTSVIFVDDGTKTFNFHTQQLVTTADGTLVSSAFSAQ